MSWFTPSMLECQAWMEFETLGAQKEIADGDWFRDRCYNQQLDLGRMAPKLSMLLRKHYIMDLIDIEVHEFQADLLCQDGLQVSWVC